MSVLSSHKPWLVVQGTSDYFFINHAHLFGAACASSNAGMIVNAVIDIWRAEGVFPVPKYEDDLKAFQFPSPLGSFVDGDFSYNYDQSGMLCHISSLGVPWHDEKGDKCFSFVTTFIGFLWDIPRKLVSLLEGKRNKFHQHILQFLIDFEGRPVICAMLRRSMDLFVALLLSISMATPIFLLSPTLHPPFIVTNSL